MSGATVTWAATGAAATVSFTGLVTSVACARARNLGSRRHGNDHGHIGISQCDCDDDGESGRVERNTVTDEPVACVDRGNGNTHTDREGRRRDHDLGRISDVGDIELVRSDGVVRWTRDRSSYGIGDNHRHVGFGEWNSRDLGCLDCRFGHALADESELRFTG